MKKKKKKKKNIEYQRGSRVMLRFRIGVHKHNKQFPAYTVIPQSTFKLEPNLNQIKLNSISIYQPMYARFVEMWLS